MKFLCECGETIRDQSDDLPYKAYAIPDPDYAQRTEWLVDRLTDLIAAIEKGSEKNWVRNYYDQEVGSLSRENVLSDLCTAMFVNNMRHMYQCPACGRLYVGDGQAPHYRLLGFRPEGHDERRLFETEAAGSDSET